MLPEPCGSAGCPGSFQCVRLQHKGAPPAVWLCRAEGRPLETTGCVPQVHTILLVPGAEPCYPSFVTCWTICKLWPLPSPSSPK